MKASGRKYYKSVGIEKECKAFLTYLIAKTKFVTGNKGFGVLYWERVLM